jgi:hypothetical protein
LKSLVILVGLVVQFFNSIRLRPSACDLGEFTRVDGLLAEDWEAAV